ncbi:MAG TPA: hypothetical protein VEA18_00595 [Candidatus Kapabacteria bacterium]|nr:hypothetical protein [Candidatus Kapabacteria bacterium]
MIPVTLWLLTVLFFLRVLGQFVVAVFAPSFLPPFDFWHSGIMPYGLLICAQVAILCLMITISCHLTRERGYFARPLPWFRWALVFGCVYFAAMIGRYMWFGLSIMVVFHWVLAMFVFLFGFYHRYGAHH